MVQAKLTKNLIWIRNPFVSLSIFLIANLISFIDFLQRPFYNLVGVAGNMVLTFAFAFFLILSGRGFSRMFNKRFFIYSSYLGIGIYVGLYFKWLLAIHYIYSVGFFIMALGIYCAFMLDNVQR